MTTTTYATVDDVLRGKRMPTNDGAFRSAIERHLEDVTRDLIREVGYSFLPAAAETTWTVNGSGCDLLHLHDGIASLTSVEIRLATRGDFVELDDEGTGWVLEGQPGEIDVLPGDPYFHVRLVAGAGYTRFPDYQPAGVRLTGRRGWSAVPVDARSAAVAWVRQRLALDPATAGQSGPEDLGVPTGPDRWPRQVYDFVNRERQRFWCAN